MCVLLLLLTPADCLCDWRQQVVAECCWFHARYQDLSLFLLARPVAPFLFRAPCLGPSCYLCVSHLSLSPSSCFSFSPSLSCSLPCSSLFSFGVKCARDMSNIPISNCPSGPAIASVTRGCHRAEILARENFFASWRSTTSPQPCISRCTSSHVGCRHGPNAQGRLSRYFLVQL